MYARTLCGLLLAAVLLALAAHAQDGGKPLLLPEEKHLRNIRQLTFSGENAEAYFSADDKMITFQSHEKEGACDQIYTMD